MITNELIDKLAKIKPLFYATDADGSIEKYIQETIADTGLPLTIARTIASGIETTVTLTDGTKRVVPTRT